MEDKGATARSPALNMSCIVCIVFHLCLLKNHKGGHEPKRWGVGGMEIFISVMYSSHQLAALDIKDLAASIHDPTGDQKLLEYFP